MKIKQLKHFIKKLIPPAIIGLKRTIFNTKPIEMWSKPYTSWAEAKAKSTGYNEDNILQKVLNSSKAVRDGKAVYERDSVLFDEIQYSWAILSILQKIALENNNSLTLVDFGGSLGSTYFQNRMWLKNIKIKWIIVEQSHFVEIGKKEFQNDILLFEYSLEEAFKHQPNVVLFSSVLQYLESPETIINQVIKYGIENILIDRTSISSNIINEVFTVQTVHEEIYKASYPCRFFNEQNLLDNFIPQYKLITNFPSYCDQPFHRNGITFLWKGFYLKNIELYKEREI